MIVPVDVLAYFLNFSDHFISKFINFIIVLLCEKAHLSREFVAHQFPDNLIRLLQYLIKTHIDSGFLQNLNLLVNLLDLHQIKIALILASLIFI